MDFVIIANAWSAGIDNPTSKHRIALELARQGHRVLWIEGAGMRKPSLGSGSDRARIWGKLKVFLRGARPAVAPAGGAGVASAIWVLTPLLAPLPTVRWIRLLNGVICACAGRVWSRRLGFRNPVLINYVPVLADAMRFWARGGGGTEVGGQRSEVSQKPGIGESGGPTCDSGDRPAIARVVYHCVDRWDAFKMYDSALMAAADEDCCRRADLVIASSRELYERCRRFSANVYLLDHGVDYEHFRAALDAPPRPKDMPDGRTVGFFGLLSEWLNQDLVVRLADAAPDAQIVLIGTPDVPIDRLRAKSNIHLLGPRPFRDLPAYIAHFDVGIIPFVVNELTRAVNPIKLREMLSAGCPVVSSNLPEVVPYAAVAARATGVPESMAVARDDEEFIRLVQLRLAQPLDQRARRALSATMTSETWAARVHTIMGLIGAPAGAREGLS